MIPHYNFDLWQGITSSPQERNSRQIWVGETKRIPADELAAIAEDRIGVEHINREWDHLTAGHFQRSLAANGWEILPGGATEKVETLDAVTGELMVMWRAPCRRNQSG